MVGGMMLHEGAWRWGGGTGGLFRLAITNIHSAFDTFVYLDVVNVVNVKGAAFTT